MTKAFDQTTILLLLMASLINHVQSFCPEECWCRPDAAVRDVSRPIRLSCSSERPLENIPEEFSHNVTHLDLNGAGLSSVRKDSNIFKMPRLVHLNLSHNDIKSIERGALGQLKTLRILDLSHNQLNLLDHGLFADENELKLVNRNKSYEYAMNDDILWIEKTEQEEEDVDDSDYDDEKKSESSRKLPSTKSSLFELDLSNNDLDNIEGALGGLESLTKLNLNRNNLKVITQITFRDLVSLRSLILSFNQLETIDPDAFISTGRLTSLMMKNNPNLQHLRRLNLRNCAHLNYLDFSECGLTGIPMGLPESLRYLQLRRNHLTEIRSDSFREFSGLNILLLDGNNISRIDDDALSGMTNLQQLWLNENHLVNLPRQLPSSLQRLLLDGNQLSSWPSNIFEGGSPQKTVPLLSILSLSGNRISEIKNDSFKELVKLTTLDLSENRIRSIPQNCFANNKALTSLNLNKNPLTQLHDKSLEGLNSLKTLFLCFIDTSAENLKMNRAVLRPVSQSLSLLEVDHSPSIIRALVLGQPSKRIQDDFVLSSLTNLQELSVTGSDLTTLAKEDFYKFLPLSLKALRFSSSRWHCDRSLNWFKEWLTNERKFTKNADVNLCHSPRSLNGKPIVSVTFKESSPAATSMLLVPLKSTKPHPIFPKLTSLIPKLRSTPAQKTTTKLFRRPQGTAESSTNDQTDSSNEDSGKDELDDKDDHSIPSSPAAGEDLVVVHVTDFIKRTELLESENEEEEKETEEDGDDYNNKQNKNDDINEATDSDLGNSGLTDTNNSNNNRIRPMGNNILNPINNNNNNNNSNNDSKKPGSTTKNSSVFDEVQSEASHSNMTEERFVITVAIAIIVVTAIVAALIIFLIVLTCRKKRKGNNIATTSSSKDSLGDSGKTIIKYKNKDGVLYFSTNSITGIGSDSSADGRSGSGSVSKSGKFRSSPTPSGAKKNGDFFSNGAHINNNNFANSNNFYNNNNYNSKTLAYRWEDT